MERISRMRNRMRESCSSGSVGGEGGNRLAYPAIIVARSFGLLEQGEVPRGDVPQLGVEVLGGNLVFAQDTEKRGYRRIGNTKHPAEQFVTVEQLGRDGAPGQHVF